MLASFVVCRGLLQLLAKAVFPVLNALLVIAFPGAGGELMRFRVALSVCWFFCFYGVVRIGWCARAALVREPLGAYAKAHETSPSAKPTATTLAMGTTVAARDKVVFRDDEVHERRGADEAGEGAGEASRHVRGAALESRWWSFSLSATTVMLTSLTTTMAVVLWPLIVRDQFAWSASEFAVLVLVRHQQHLSSPPRPPNLSLTLMHIEKMTCPKIPLHENPHGNMRLPAFCGAVTLVR